MAVTKEEIEYIKSEYEYRSNADGSIRGRLTYFNAYWPDRLYDLDRLVAIDKDAARQIEDLQKFVDDLKIFRRMYADRYNELCSMHSVPVVKLKRYKGEHVTYTLTTCRRLDNGREFDIKETKYDGKNRRQAIEDFDRYVKDHPGIIAEKGIAKRSWER